MSDLLRIPLNLQFFAESEDGAEETSENTAEVAEQSQEQGSEEQGAEQQDTEINSAVVDHYSLEEYQDITKVEQDYREKVAKVVKGE